MSKYDYDYLVIGAGSGGSRSARIAASHGAKVAIAEGKHFGGTCVNLGCIPKKMFTYAADYGTALEEMKGYGWQGGDHVSFDWLTLRNRKDAEIKRLGTNIEKKLGEAGVTVLHGMAAFIDPHTVKVGEKQVTAGKILIATGGRPRKPDFPGCEHVVVSDDIFTLEEFPRSVVIQGGGYIAVECAHFLHGMGADVTVLYHNTLWMRGFDDDIRQFLCESYTKQGINVLFNSDIAQIARKNDKTLHVQTTDNHDIYCDLVLSAIGRIPNTDALNLDNANVQTDKRGRISVGEHWQTSAPHIHAVGDVCNAHNLTPYAIAEGHILADTLFGGDADFVREVNLDLVPTAVFSSPPIGTVGLTVEQAREKGYEIDVYRTNFRPLRHSLSDSQTRTLMKLIVCRKTQKVIGCHMCGEDTPEILQGIAIAMNAGATKQDFNRTLGIHPTAAEELVTLKTPLAASETK